MTTKRDLGITILLNVVTLGLYAFYWIPAMGDDVNRIVKRPVFSFWVTLAVSIITCGIGLSVFETLYAYELEKDPRYRKLGGRPWLWQIVLGLNVAALILAFVSAGIAIILSIGLGIWASWLVQEVLNRQAELDAPAQNPYVA
jgi:hypothetical protein